MNRPVEEIMSDLDAMQDQNAQIAEPVEGSVEDQGIDDQETDQKTDDEAKATPGFIPYDEWVASGKDPDKYKGKKAYEAEYERIQENKALRNEVREVKGLVKTVVDAAEKTRVKQLEEHRRELESRLSEQKKNYDIDGAIETTAEIARLNEKPAEKVEPHPAIIQFIEDNPILNPNKPEYNKDFEADMIAFQNSLVDAMSGNGKRALTDAQIEKINKKAFEQAREMNSDLFTSPRNNRAGPGRQTRQSKDTRSLADITVSVPGKQPSSTAANDIYEMIKKMDPQKAEQYKKNVLTNFGG